MPSKRDVEEVALALKLSVGLFLRRLRQAPVDGELTLPESSALSRLDHAGPRTASDLARAEQISPQSMGATLAALEANGLVERTPDAEDGRRSLISPTARGLDVLRSRRNARVQQISAALATGFTPDELELLRSAAPLIERLAQSM